MQHILGCEASYAIRDRAGALKARRPWWLLPIPGPIPDAEQRHLSLPGAVALALVFGERSSVREHPWSNGRSSEIAQAAAGARCRLLVRSAGAVSEPLVPAAGSAGSAGRELAELAWIDVLIVEDCGLASDRESARLDLLEIMAARYGNRSTILTSQLPVKQ